ncbi:MAG: DUF3048 domain-containing protein [Actinomycetota bacterium]|nr:DUF3048 domain-containing protein [Actinomycetota bacterium]MEE2957409.1 DUF3048 domain-containing protein [Actinomycetota bacterium]
MTRRPAQTGLLAGALLAGALLMVSACSGGEEVAPDPTLPTIAPTTTEAPPDTTAVPEAPATTTELSGGEEAVEQVATPSTTTIEGWTGPVHPLTGLPAVDGIADRPVLVVKIGNNDSKSLPQVGLQSADIVYEAHIENGVTRFLGVFHSEVPLTVGPVRSARSSDIDLIGNLNRPVFAYWGSNQGVGDEVAEAERQGTFVPMTTTGDGQEFFYRDKARGDTPYNGFVDAAAMAARSDGSAPQPVFEVGPLSATAVPVRGVGWRTPRREIDWVWDRGTTRWLRFHRGVPLLDEDGVQLAADNVLLLYVDHRRSDADLESPQAISTGSGDGWLLRDGTVTGVLWSRPFTADPWRLVDDETGEPVSLRSGRTWVALARLGEGVLLGPDRIAELLG